MQLSKLLQQYQLQPDFILKNRIVLSPLNTQSALFDGSVSLNDVVFHRQHARHVGMAIVGSAYVSDSGNTAFGSISAADDTKIPGLEMLAHVIHEGGSKAILQLVHAGRMTNRRVTKGQPILAPSSIKAERGDVAIPRELRLAEISEIIDQFSTATKRAIKAGFDGVEIHGANTFLLQQFMSPNSNRRNDMYGGSLENRMKFPVSVVNQVKAVVQQFAERPFIIGYRLSPEEAEVDGLTIKDNLMLAVILKKAGIQYLNLSLNHYNQLPLTSDQLQKFAIADIFQKAIGTNLPLIVGGGIRDQASLEAANGDLIGLGSQLFVDPDWLQSLKKGESATNSVTFHIPYGTF